MSKPIRKTAAAPEAPREPSPFLASRAGRAAAQQAKAERRQSPADEPAPAAADRLPEARRLGPIVIAFVSARTGRPCTRTLRKRFRAERLVAKLQAQGVTEIVLVNDGRTVEIA